MKLPDTTAAKTKALQEKIAMLETKRREILDSYITDSITLAEFQNVQKRINGEKDKINKEIALLTQSDDTIPGNKKI
jgi:molecular chaperone GrpE (heat shock protein)